jgi:hypothetical protein
MIHLLTKIRVNNCPPNSELSTIIMLDNKQTANNIKVPLTKLNIYTLVIIARKCCVIKPTNKGLTC